MSVRVRVRMRMRVRVLSLGERERKNLFIHMLQLHTINIMSGVCVLHAETILVYFAVCGTISIYVYRKKKILVTSIDGVPLPSTPLTLTKINYKMNVRLAH